MTKKKPPRKDKLLAGRHRDIFHMVEVKGISINEVAEVFDYSAGHVRRIVREGREKLQDPKLRAEMEITKWLYLLRLDSQWREAMEAWQRSQKEVEISKATRLTEEGKPEKTKAERTTRSQNGDVRFLQHALKILERIAEMSSLDELTSTESGDGDLCDVRTASDDEKRAELARILLGIRDRVGIDPDHGADRRDSAGSTPPPDTAP